MQDLETVPTGRVTALARLAAIEEFAVDVRAGLRGVPKTPCELETSRPGVFAAGDVRSGTTKRCAFAAGDGALGVWYLAH